MLCEGTEKVTKKSFLVFPSFFFVVKNVCALLFRLGLADLPLVRAIFVTLQRALYCGPIAHGVVPSHSSHVLYPSGILQ